MSYNKMMSDDFAQKLYANDDFYRPWLSLDTNPRYRPLLGNHAQQSSGNRPQRPFGIPRSQNREMMPTPYPRYSPQSQSYSLSPGYGSYGGAARSGYGSQPPYSGVFSSSAPTPAYGAGAPPSTAATAIPPVGPPFHGRPGHGMAPPSGGYGGPPPGLDYNRPPGHFGGSTALGGPGPMPGGPGGDYGRPTDYGRNGGRCGFQGNNSSNIPILLTERRLSDTLRNMEQKGQVAHSQSYVPLPSAAKNEVTCGVKFPKGCSFCRKNGESADFYRQHQLKCAFSGNVLCPILRAYICKVCGARGNKAHTISYCPLLKEKKMEELKNKK